MNYRIQIIQKEIIRLGGDLEGARVSMPNTWDGFDTVIPVGITMADARL